MSKNLLQRIITSTILFTALLILNFGNQLVLILSLAILSIVICYEFNGILSKIFKKKNLKFHKKNTNIEKFNIKFIFFNIIAFSYVFFVFFQFSYQIHKTEGPIFFLLIVSVCFFTDIGGYFVGKIMGGKKLTKISPNKTISGAIGSFIFSIIPLIIVLKLNYLNLVFSVNTLIFITLISLISQIGDLFISYLKRKAKIKDTGKILPGHGGILDRVDGMIFALPFSYFLLKII